MKGKAYLIPLLLILLAMGLYIYFSNSSKKETTITTETVPSQSSEITQTPTIAVATATLTPAPTIDELQLITKAMAQKLGKSEQTLDVSVSQNTGQFAKGSVSEKGSDTGGGYFLAAKTSGAWVIVYDGQAAPTCAQLSPYNFPITMVPECLDSNGNVVKR